MLKAMRFIGPDAPGIIVEDKNRRRDKTRETEKYHFLKRTQGNAYFLKWYRQHTSGPSPHVCTILGGGRTV